MKLKSFDQGGAAQDQMQLSLQKLSENPIKENEQQQESDRCYTDMKQQPLNTEMIEYFELVGDRNAQSKLYKMAYRMISHYLFDGFFFLLCIANTIDLCLDRYPITDDESHILDLLNQIFYGFFLLEFILKLLGLGFKLYFKDKFNIFDLIIILLSTVDIAVKHILGENSSSQLLIAFRAFRLLRIFKLVRSWTSLQDIAVRMKKTIRDIISFSILLFLFMFIYALLGMELFAHRIKYDAEGDPIDPDLCNDLDGCFGLGESPRQNFDNFPNALLYIFILVIGDDWNQVMFEYVRLTNLWSILFFVTLTAFGNLILLNLFLAILLTEFEQSHQEDQASKGQLWIRIKSFFTRFKIKFCREKAKKYEIQNLDQSPDQNARNLKKKNEGHQDFGKQFELHNSILFSPQAIDVSHQKKSLSSRYEHDENIQELQIKVIDASFEPQQASSEEQGQINSQRPFLLSPLSNQDNFNHSNILDESTTQVLQIQGHPNKNSLPNIQTIENRHHSMQMLELSFDNRSQYEERKRVPKIESNNQLLQSERNLKVDSAKNIVPFFDSHPSRKNSEKSQKGKSDQEIKVLFGKTLTNINLKVKEKLHGKSLNLFSNKNKCRIYTNKLVKTKFFDGFILFLILCSTITLALDLPLSDPDDDYNTILFYLDLSFSIFFGFECILKIVSDGLFMNGKSSYLKDRWNIMDFCIILLSFASLILSRELRIIKSLRLIRIVRPLRMISKNEDLRIAVLYLINSLKHIANVFVIAIFCFSVYAIFGVSFFKGEFFYCHTSHLPGTLIKQLDYDQSFTKWHCLASGGEWLGDRSNFNNVFYAVLALFQMATTEGWVDVMHSGIDSTQIDYSYLINNNLWNSLYFVFFILLGSVFVMNMFVGVVINTFKFEKDKLGLNYMLSETQKEWVKVLVKCHQLMPVAEDPEIKQRWRKNIARIGKSQIFEGFIYTCIVINIGVMACSWYMMPQDIEEAFDIINSVFTAIFTIEAIVKIITLGSLYFKNGWNNFDFILILGTYIQLIVNSLFQISIGTPALVLRIFRIGRIARIIKKAQSLRKIFNTFLRTIPSLANIGFILFLLIYIYALIGINLFGRVKLHDSLDDHANFQDFASAFLVLIRCATGEGWNDIMKSLMDQNSIIFDCMQDPQYEDFLNNNGEANGCGNYWSSMIFFCSYQLLVTFIILNLFIAIILEGFNETAEDTSLRIDDFMLAKFVKLWKQYDPKAIQFINAHSFKSFLIDLISVEKGLIKGGEYLLKNHKELNYFIAQLQLPLYQNFTCYNFYDVLTHLSKSVFMIDFARASFLRSQSTTNLLYKQGSSLSGKAYSNSTKGLQGLQHLHEDQLDFESFEDLLVHLYKLTKAHKIQLFEQFKALRLDKDQYKFKDRDRYEGHEYDSRVIIYLPVLINKMRNFVSIVKKQRQEAANKNQMLIDAKEQIQMLKTHDIGRIFQKKRNSIFYSIAQNQQKEEEIKTFVKSKKLSLQLNNVPVKTNSLQINEDDMKYEQKEEPIITEQVQQKHQSTVIKNTKFIEPLAKYQTKLSKQLSNLAQEIKRGSTNVQQQVKIISQSHQSQLELGSLGGIVESDSVSDTSSKLQKVIDQSPRSDNKQLNSLNSLNQKGEPFLRIMPTEIIKEEVSEDSLSNIQDQIDTDPLSKKNGTWMMGTIKEDNCENYSTEKLNSKNLSKSSQIISQNRNSKQIRSSTFKPQASNNFKVSKQNILIEELKQDQSMDRVNRNDSLREQESLFHHQNLLQSPTQGMKPKNSQLTFGRKSSNKLIQALNADQPADKKFSTQTAQLFLSSMNDLMQERRSSNKLSSVRYNDLKSDEQEENVDIQIAEYFSDLDEQNGEQAEMKQMKGQKKTDIQIKSQFSDNFLEFQSPIKANDSQNLQKPIEDEAFDIDSPINTESDVKDSEESIKINNRKFWTKMALDASNSSLPPFE